MGDKTKTRTIQKKHSWLRKVIAYINVQLYYQRHLVISDISEEMHISERQFFRKMKKLTGKTPNQFIQEVRMQKAQKVLEKGQFKTIEEVARIVGFKDPEYFSRLYCRFFSRRPSSYLNKSTKMAV